MLHFNEQRRFFWLWEESVVYDVVRLVKAGLGMCGADMTAYQSDEKRIMQEAGDKRGGVDKMDEALRLPYPWNSFGLEIRNNLDGMSSGERGGYIYTLVEPFREYQGVKFDGVDEEQARMDFNTCTLNLKKWYAWFFFGYENVVQKFGRALDLLLLERGINLQWYERALGVPSLADWRKNERETEAARHFGVDIREAIKVVGDALPRLGAEKPAAGQNTAENGIRGRLLKGGGDLLAMLHRLIDGRRGKAVALVLYACMELGYMTRPTQGELLDEFDMIGSWESVCKYLRGGAYMLDRKEVEAVKARLSEVVERPENVDSVPKTATRNG